jgi:hypothetical protein
MNLYSTEAREGMTKRELLFQAQASLCFYCGEPFASMNGTCETLLLPKVHGGTRQGSNVLLGCKQCVHTKGDRMPRDGERKKAKAIYQVFRQLAEEATPKRQRPPKTSESERLRRSLDRIEKMKQESRIARKARREKLVRRTDWGACGRKIKHATYSTALAHLLTLPGSGLVAYKCATCTGYHVGHLHPQESAT